MSQLNETIGVLEKNKNTLTSVKLVEFSGKQAIDIREYYQNAAGELCPTKKGVFIDIEHISQLVNLVEQAEAKYNDYLAKKSTH